MSEIVKVAELFCDAVKKYGKRKILTAIKKVHQEKVSNHSHEIVSFILDTVCPKYDLTPLDIKKDKVLRSNLECRELCILFISEYTDLKHLQIASEFNLKSKYEISRAINSFKDKNPKIKQDALFLENYNELKPTIEKFIQSL